MFRLRPAVQFLEIDHPQVDDFVRSMEADWRALCESGFHVEGIDGFSLSFEPAPAGKLLSLARELAALQVPPCTRCSCWRCFPPLTDIWSGWLLRLIAAVLPDYMAP